MHQGRDSCQERGWLVRALDDTNFIYTTTADAIKIDGSPVTYLENDADGGICCLPEDQHRRIRQRETIIENAILDAGLGSTKLLVK